ncbi:MAG TPA: O-antigen ligase family protein [Gaiellaceae bacterium]|jgi:cytochrome c-type biogenesis protein CcmH/NrfG|nr:O-antigen ligase family protein [Gaiellaceae bacterium]
MLRALDRRAALLLGAGGALIAASTLFSYGSSGGRLTWLGVAGLSLAAAVGVAALAGWARPSLGLDSLVALGFLVAFVCWSGISVLWSIEGDRSWSSTNRGLAYLAFAVVGLVLGPYVRQWAYVLAGVLALPLGWALLGKAIPALGGSGRVARLSSPIGYWNALGLLFAMALPLALWLAARRSHPHWLRACGVVYVYALVVGLLLTYSRGGVLAAGVAVVLWLVLGSPRVESAAAILLGGGAGLGVAVWAFSRPGLAEDGQSHAVRVHDGVWFAVVFVLATVAVGALAYLGSLAEERRPLSDARRRLMGRVALGVLVAGVAVGLVALTVEAKPQGWFREFTSQPTDASLQGGPQHLANASSSSRWLWWKEAWHAWEKQPWRGTGAGTFELTHRLLRTNDIVVTEPHNVPLQFLSETGLVGFFFALVAIGAAAVGVVRRVRGLTGEERAAAVALAVLAVAYVLHSLVDFDWDFVAVTGPFLVSVGALLGGPAVRDSPRVALAPVPVVVAIAVALSLLTPWFAERGTDSARGAIADGRPLRAYREARDARSLNPLALDPLLVQAAALEQLGDFQGARQVYIDAVELQPLNWRPWYYLGLFEVGQQDWARAIPPLERAVHLDPLNPFPVASLKQARSQGG